MLQSHLTCFLMSFIHFYCTKPRIDKDWTYTKICPCLMIELVELFFHRVDLIKFVEIYGTAVGSVAVWVMLLHEIFMFPQEVGHIKFIGINWLLRARYISNKRQMCYMICQFLKCSKRWIYDNQKRSQECSIAGNKTIS